MLTGQNGILNRAAEAKEKTSVAEESEGIKLAIYSEKMRSNYSDKITKDNLEEALKIQFGKK